MKRLLLSLFVIIAAVSFTNATDVTFNLTDPAALGYAVPESGAGTDLADGTMTVGNVVIKSTKINETTDNRFWATKDGVEGLRCYKPSTLTFSTTNGEIITAITFEGKAIASTILTFDSGEYAQPTWTGSESQVVLTFAGTAKISSIVVTTTTGEAPAVAVPVFNPGEGTYYGPVEVTLSCATEGADIWYKLSKSAPQFTAYTGPIKVESTTTIIAAAAVGTTFSDVVSATYTISEAKSVENIADFYTQSQSLAVKFANPVNVLYQSGAYLFVQDATGALQIYGNVGQTYKNGDIIPAGFMGFVGEFGEVIQLSNPVAETFAAAEEGAVIKPTVVKVNEITETMLNRLIQVNNANVNLEGGKTLTDESGTITLFARFNEVSLPADDKAYDVTAIVSSFKGALQLFPISFTLTNTGIANVDNAASRVEAGYNVINVNAAEDAQVTIVNSVGQVLVNKAVTAGANAIPVSAGFYLVKVGDVVTKVVVR